MRKRNPLTLSSIAALLLCAGCAGGKLFDSSASILDDKRQPRPYPAQSRGTPLSVTPKKAEISQTASTDAIGTGVSSASNESARAIPAAASAITEVTIANRHQHAGDQSNVLQIPASRISNAARNQTSTTSPEPTNEGPAKAPVAGEAPAEIADTMSSETVAISVAGITPVNETHITAEASSTGMAEATATRTPAAATAQPGKTIDSPPTESVSSLAGKSDPPQALRTADELLPEDPQERLEWLRERLIKAMEDNAKVARQTGKKEEANRLDEQLRLAYLLTENTDEAVRGIEALPEAEREAFKQIIFGLSQFLDEEDARRPTHRNARVAKALREAIRELSPASRLELKNLAFCERVEQFGWFTEFRRAEFAPKQQVILYVEIENATAEEKSQHNFETELAGSYQVFDDNGKLVHEKTLPLDKETCRNYRRDYFLAYRIYLPEDIAPGHYRLELMIEDLKAKRTGNRKLGEGLIEFRVR